MQWGWDDGYLEVPLSWLTSEAIEIISQFHSSPSPSSDGAPPPPASTTG